VVRAVYTWVGRKTAALGASKIFIVSQKMKKTVDGVGWGEKKEKQPTVCKRGVVSAEL
jgi:hypothetical protein